MSSSDLPRTRANFRFCLLRQISTMAMCGENMCTRFITRPSCLDISPVSSEAVSRKLRKLPYTGLSRSLSCPGTPIQHHLHVRRSHTTFCQPDRPSLQLNIRWRKQSRPGRGEDARQPAATVQAAVLWSGKPRANSWEAGSVEERATRGWAKTRGECQDCKGKSPGVTRARGVQARRGDNNQGQDDSCLLSSKERSHANERQQSRPSSACRL